MHFDDRFEPFHFEITFFLSLARPQEKGKRVEEGTGGEEAKDGREKVGYSQHVMLDFSFSFLPRGPRQPISGVLP